MDAVIEDMRLAHLSPETLERVADFFEYGGAPLRGAEHSAARRVSRLVGGDPQDVAAVFYAALEATR